MDVSGDFYDVFALDDGAWTPVIGDVLGKGARRAHATSAPRHRLRRRRALTTPATGARHAAAAAA
jgi:serine phosphatase RsbU (regulator of sigma subunit)